MEHRHRCSTACDFKPSDTSTSIHGKVKITGWRRTKHRTLEFCLYHGLLLKETKKTEEARRRKLENHRALGNCPRPSNLRRVSAQSITPGEGPAARENAVRVTQSAQAWDGDVLPGMAQPQSSTGIPAPTLVSTET